MHTYPSELGHSAAEVTRLMRQHRVLMVDMGHTHYNEIANDGHTIYATTRSTGQIEEGPVGFSLANLDGNVVSWKFKPLGDWPFVMITAPADAAFITDAKRANQLLRGTIEVRAKAWAAWPSVRPVAGSMMDHGGGCHGSGRPGYGAMRGNRRE
jgi:Icc protein